MQSVLEQLCRCFGSTPINHDLTDMESLSLAQSHDGRQRGHQQQVPATPDMKRRTRSLALQDKQWDALFSPEPSSLTTRQSATAEPTNPVSPDAGRSSKPNLPALDHIAVEQAHAVAKAKLAANPTRFRSHRRKRSRSRSRDDIFRSKKQDNKAASCTGNGTGPNPISRFLTNHPVLAQSLCFATPIRDPDEEPDEVPLDAASVVSGNTLNTAEDTITSTLYYETTKLAGLHQKNPPMPLFNNFQVDERDDIHRIVATHSHSSAKMIDLVREVGLEVVELDDDDDDDTPPATPSRPRSEDLEPPPPMEQMSSSDSSQKSGKS